MKKHIDLIVERLKSGKTIQFHFEDKVYSATGDKTPQLSEPDIDFWIDINDGEELLSVKDFKYLYKTAEETNNQTKTITTIDEKNGIKLIVEEERINDDTVSRTYGIEFEDENIGWFGKLRPARACFEYLIGENA